MADNDKARRLNNLTNAKLFIKAGLYLFPSSGKTPLVPRFNKIDTEISQEDREKAIEEFETKHGEAPVHVGATNDPAVLSKMFKRHQDCVWSIACGPSKLVVIDADSKDNGPELIGKHFEEHGLPEGCIVVPTQSGGRHYIFKDPESKFTNSAGALKSKYGCDVRGSRGQYVSPGSIREDGKTYGTQKDATAFRRAYSAGTLPELPNHIAELIGTAGAASQSVNEAELLPFIQELQETDWPDHADLFDPTIGTYDIEALKVRNPEFAEAYDRPDGDCSDARWAVAQHLLHAFKMPITHLAVFYEGWEGAGTQTDDGKGSGNYRLRDIAREWIKNKDLYVDLDAMGAVDEATDEDDPEEAALAEYDKEIEAERQEEREAVAAIESKRGQLHALSEIAVYCSPDYVIENMYTPGSVGMMHGPSNIGKTFSAWYQALCIAEGWKYFGRNVEQSGVLYCYGEGHAGMQNRALAYKQKYGPKTDHLIVRDGIPNFATDPKIAKRALRKAIKEANAQLESKALKPLKTVFLDTFAKAVAGAEENSTREMQPIMNALREIALEMGVCIIIIHHSGKDAGNGARGSSAIFADVDFNIEIVDPASSDGKRRKLKAGKGNLVMVMPKMRDSGKSGVAEFRLEEVRLGENKWGNPVTSMVVVPIGQTPSDGAAMGAVDDDEEPGTIKDELTADQNRQAEQARIELCQKVLAVLRQIAKPFDKGMQATVAEVVERLPSLAKLKADGGTKNFARNLRDALLGGEPRVLLPEGWIEYVPATGKKSSLLRWAPRES